MNIKRILDKIRKFIYLKNQQKIHKTPLLRLGSKYGSWSVPHSLLNENSVCYLAGAGEDISFDTAIAERFACSVFIFDPTPRAKSHFEALSEAVKQGKSMAVNNEEFYDVSAEKLKHIKFFDLGLWDKSELLKFYEPENPEHVSHSALNLQQTNKYFEAKVQRLSAIMKELGHSQLDLLKLDIEGAEYKVIESILEDKPDIKCICIEFDETHHALDSGYLKRIASAISGLKKVGYVVIDIDKEYNYTFCRKDLYTSLSAR